MLIVQNLSYTHPNKDVLFKDIQLSLSTGEKIALLGNNGSGKSTLLKIMAGLLSPITGQIHLQSDIYYMPQLYGQYDQQSIAEVWQINDKLKALQYILDGSTDPAHFECLNDDWALEERCREALDRWQLTAIDPDRLMGSLSGGQQSRAMLAGIDLRPTSLLLLDEPSNHLDRNGREQLYQQLQASRQTCILVSHDRELLSIADKIWELEDGGIQVYGGNYAFYVQQKAIEQEAQQQDIHNAAKNLRKAREQQRESIERQQKADARGKKKQEKAGVARIMMNTLRNTAENSSAKMKQVHEDKTGLLSEQLKKLRAEQKGMEQMRFDFEDSALHKGKLLFKTEGLNFGYDNQLLWPEPGLHITIYSGQRIALQGHNGCGKSSFLQLLLGKLSPQSGNIYSSSNNTVYIDQDYSLLRSDLSVYEQAQQYNHTALKEHEIKTRLHRFLFGPEHWQKSCAFLSGGERMRLSLCCLHIGNAAPDIILLDEPTNNLDIHNMEILANAINSYKGTLIVVSHDKVFLEQLGIERQLLLPVTA